jgi:hypothetical protein
VNLTNDPGKEIHNMALEKIDTKLAEQIIRLEYLVSQFDHKDLHYEAALEQALALAYIARALEATKGLAA